MIVLVLIESLMRLFHISIECLHPYAYLDLVHGTQYLQVVTHAENFNNTTNLIKKRFKFFVEHVFIVGH